MRLTAVTKESICVSFSYDQSIVEQIKRIPGARYRRIEKTWVVPVSEDAYAVLRNFTTDLSLFVSLHEFLRQPVSDTLIGYRWKMKPFLHQQEGTSLLVKSRCFALHDEMGLGKSKTVIDAIGALYDAGDITGVIVVCPLGVIDVWEEQIALHGVTPPTIWTLINYEKVRCLRHRTPLLDKIKTGKVVVVLDEGHRIKSPRTLQTRGCIELGVRAAYRWLLTGTPIAKDVLDLWAQFAFLDKRILGSPSYTAFKHKYAVMGGYCVDHRPVQIIGWKHTDEITKKIARFSRRALKADCLDLPEKLFTTRSVPMTAAQFKHYKEIKTLLVTKTDKTLVMTPNALTKALRLSQITSGHLPETTLDNPKLDMLRTLIEEHEGSYIVYCRFIPELQRILDILPPDTATIHGAIKPTQRTIAERDFQSGVSRGIVLQIATGGIGLTLTQASMVVYMSNTYSWVDRAQSMDRPHRPGLTHPVLYVDVLATTPTGKETIDHGVLKISNAKKNLAEVTLGDIIL